MLSPATIGAPAVAVDPPAWFAEIADPNRTGQAAPASSEVSPDTKDFKETAGDGEMPEALEMRLPRGDTHLLILRGQLKRAG